MDMMGPFPKKMLKKALFSDKHFDDDYNLSLMEEDPVTKSLIRRVIANPKPGKDMAQVL
jgi:serine/threonine-protein kinase PRP4